MKKPDKFKLDQIKKYLLRGDHSIIAERVKTNHGIEITKFAVRRTLSANDAYFHEVIYNEALKLSIERKNMAEESRNLEKEL